MKTIIRGLKSNAPYKQQKAYFENEKKKGIARVPPISNEKRIFKILELGV